MPDVGAELWPFFVVVILTVTILVLAVGASMVLNRRQLLRLQAAYTTRLVQVQDAERRVMAAQVHDEMAQRVSQVRNELIRHGEQADLDPPQATVLHFLEAELGELRTDLRKLAHRLHPTRVDQAGLVVALNGLCDELESGGGFKVHRHFADQLMPVKEPGWAIYRIVQESLLNAQRHGGAREAWVTVRRDGAQVVAEIRDAGTGFDTSARRAPLESGLGLILMRERATLVGGRLSVDSHPGQGTTVRATIPAEAPPGDEGERVLDV